MNKTTTYYISTSGNDSNSGTISLPWRTIQKAANTISAGDIAYVRGGTYYERVAVTRAGSLNNYLTIAAYPGESVTIDANTQVVQWQGAIDVRASWVKIIGFTIINSYWCGVWIQNTNNVYIQNCIIHDIKRSGLISMDSSYITYDGCTVYATQQDDGTGGQQNENVNMINVTNFEIKYCHVYNTANYESIDVKQGGGYGLIHHNDITPNTSAGIYIDSQGQNMTNIDIYNNIIRSGSGSGVRGIALGVETGGSLKNCRVFNNIVYGMGAMGINPATSYSAGPVDNISVVNNTVYNCGLTDGWGGGIIVEYANATNIILRNNICYANGGRGDIVPNGNTTQDRNLTSNPNFVSTSTPDFHLQSNSPAINAGSSTQFVPGFDFDNCIRPSGTYYDIGACEYGACVTLCPSNLTCSLLIA